MYGYSRYEPLTTEEVLKRATQEQIFNIVIPGDINEEDKYLAPYRSDNNPQCYFIEGERGVLLFVDFASPFRYKNMDCFQVLKYTFDINHNDVLHLINDKLNLGLGDSSGKVREKLESVEEREILTHYIKREKTITIKPRLLNVKDKHFWEQYEISSDNLLEDGVVAVEMYRGYSRKNIPFTVRPLDITYAYTKFYDIKGNVIEGKVKVYRPTMSKEGKWFTNCNQDNIGFLEYLPEEGEKLLITKAYKCARVVKNQGATTIWLQNEGMFPSEELFKLILSRFKEVIIWFDNDSTGIATANALKAYIEEIIDIPVRVVFLPPKYLREHNVKDPSDLIVFSKEDLNYFIKHFNII